MMKRLSKRLSKGRDADMKKLKEISAKPYKEQAIWFLNAFWNNAKVDAPRFKDNQKDCETVWKFTQECINLDPKGEEGSELDEVLAHRLLEKVERALTVVELREVMRNIDIDFNRMVSLIEFLLYKFNADWKVMVNATKEQGEEMEAILAETQALVDSAASQLRECQELAEAAAEAEKVAREEEQHAIEEEQRAKEAEEDAREKEKVFAEAEAKAQEAEDNEKKEADKLAAAVAELEAEEEAYENEKKHLEAESKRKSVGIVKRGKAANELHQLLAKETVGLREAKLRQQAALRRQEKAVLVAAEARALAQRARKPFQDATKAAEQARKDAEEARESAAAAAVEAERAREEADAAVETSMAAYNEAHEALEKIKAEFANCNQGRFWYMDRELEHAKQFMSKKQLEALEASKK